MGGGGKFSLSVGDGERLQSNFVPPFLENIHRRSCNDGSRGLFAVFHNPYQKCRPSPSVVARTMEYLLGVPSYAESSRREES